jgi:hypothetical protein
MFKPIVRRLAVVAVAMAAAVGLSACSDLVAGDSLVVNATAADGAPTSVSGTGESTVDGVTLQGFSGGAPCDYQRFMQAALDKYKPKRISFAWSGNAETPCMKDSLGRPLTGAALTLKYHNDLVTLTKFFASKNVGVIYSAPICVSPNVTGVMNGNPLIRQMESRLATNFAAQHYHVAYSEYAALQICPGWQYNGLIRQTDGLHLNSTGGAIYSTALRYESKHTVIP